MSRYQPYLSYKESGVAWLGAAPAHWRSVNLKWISKIYSGGTPDKTNLSYWNEGTIPWLGSGEVNQFYITTPTTYITEEAYSKSSAKWIPKDALVMALAGQGKTKGMVAQLGIETTCNQSMAAIVLSEKIHPRFILWWLSSNYENIRNLAGGDLRDGLNLELLGGIFCPFMELSEQTAIVNFLDIQTAKIGTLIAKQERMIELLNEKRSAIISHAVTKGLDLDVKMKNSGVEWLGEVPEHWEVKKTKTFFKLITQPAPANNDYELLSIYTDIGVRPRKDLEAKGNKASTTDSYWMVDKGDLIVNKLLAWMGAIGYSAYDGVTSPAYDILRPSSEVNSMFYHYLFRTKIAQQEFKRWSRGIMEMRLRLYFDELGSLPMPVPPKEEQNQIIDYIQTAELKIDTLISKAQQTIELMKERRTALISAAVMGKIDVRGLN